MTKIEILDRIALLRGQLRQETRAKNGAAADVTRQAIENLCTTFTRLRVKNWWKG